MMTIGCEAKNVMMDNKPRPPELKNCDPHYLVSVIVPVYNVAHYLNEALDSVINQSYKNLEIIIIDDGSTDGSAEICDNYQYDKRVQVIHQENKGLSATRNVGLDMMMGDAVAFLDSDDTYNLDYIKLMLEAMDRDKTDMVVCRFLTVYSLELNKVTKGPNVMPSISQNVYDSNTAIQALYTCELNVNVWNKLYKSDLWRSTRFSEGHVFEDNEVAYKIMALCDHISVIDNVLYTHRKRPESITTTHSLNNVRDQLLARSRVEDFIRLNVPDLFSEDQLTETRVSRITEMIGVYSCSYRESEWKKYKDELRSQIIDISTAIDLRKVQIRIACLMMRFCPWMIKPLFSIYSSFRRLAQSITGKRSG